MFIKHFPGLKTIYDEWDFFSFHRENVVVWAKAENVRYNEHTAPLSIKFCPRGCETYELNRVPLAVENDKILIINNDENYASYIISNESVESFCIFFADEIANEILGVLRKKDDDLLDNPNALTNSQTPLFQNLRNKNSLLLPHLKKMHRVVSNGQSSQIWLDEQCQNLVRILLDDHDSTLKKIEKFPMRKPSTRIEIYRRLNLARDFLESCYEEQINLKKLSRIACLSPHHFLRLFKIVFQKTPHQYLTEIRLQKALKMVSENKSSITDICFNVGFENPSSFARLFKKRFGFSPSELGKQAKQKNIFPE